MPPRPNPSYRWLLCLLPLGLTSCATLSPAPRSVVSVTVAESEARATIPERETYDLVFGGDVTPCALLEPFLLQYGDDYPFAGIAPYFREADLGLVNLESPLSCRGRPAKKQFTFRARPELALALKRAGIGAVALANNHILDYGSEALADTLQALDAAAIARSGAGKNLEASRQPASIQLGSDLTVALLSYTLTYPDEFWAGPRRPGTAFGHWPWVEADVASACAWADLVVVCFHWGGELVKEPRAYQQNLGRRAIEAGARIVVGTHPHILQGIEFYRDGVIFYSLGNLVFGGGASRQAVDSALAKVRVTRTGQIESVWVLPLSVDNRATAFVPRPLAGADQAGVLSALENLSRPWGTRISVGEGPWQSVRPPAE